MEDNRGNSTFSIALLKHFWLQVGYRIAMMKSYALAICFNLYASCTLYPNTVLKCSTCKQVR